MTFIKGLTFFKQFTKLKFSVVRIKIAYQGLGFVMVIMIVVTIVTKWKIVTQEFVWLTSFDVLLENVFLFIGNVSICILNRGIIKFS